MLPGQTRIHETEFGYETLDMYEISAHIEVPILEWRAEIDKEYQDAIQAQKEVEERAEFERLKAKFS